MPEAQKLPIQFIAKREHFKDNLYGTGVWSPLEIKLVDAAVASRMIRHTDTYKQTTAEEAAEQSAVVVQAEVKKTEDDQNDNATQDLRDRVTRMDRDSVIEYAGVHYGLKIPGNTSTEKAREQLIQHIDLAGPQ